MKLQRRTLSPAGAEQTTASLHERFHPGSWVVEAGCAPPPAHRPARLLAHMPREGRMAASLRTSTLLPLNLGPEFVEQLEAIGCFLGPFADVAVHEILVNAAIHGNLQVNAGSAVAWSDLAAREDRVAAALADEARASCIVTIAVGWDAHDVAVVIADEGKGYTDAPPQPVGAGTARAAGRGLMLARAAAKLDVLRGGTCTRLIFPRQLTPAHG